MAKILMIVAQKGFRDEELLVPKEVLETEGHTVKIASMTRGKASGAKGLVIDPHMAVYEANPEFFDAIIIVGGPGAHALAEREEVLELVRQMNGKGRVVAAICVGPLTLANAGVLAGKEATVFPDRESIRRLRDSGASYRTGPVVQDGNVITADGPHSAGEFGRAVADALKGKGL